MNNPPKLTHFADVTELVLYIGHATFLLTGFLCRKYENSLVLNTFFVVQFK